VDYREAFSYQQLTASDAKLQALSTGFRQNLSEFRAKSLKFRVKSLKFRAESSELQEKRLEISSKKLGTPRKKLETSSNLPGSPAFLLEISSRKLDFPTNFVSFPRKKVGLSTTERRTPGSELEASPSALELRGCEPQRRRLDLPPRTFTERGGVVIAFPFSSERKIYRPAHPSRGVKAYLDLEEMLKKRNASVVGERRVLGRRVQSKER
jgi:hypothetical protein